MRRCFFIGHRDAPERIYPALCAAVDRADCLIGYVRDTPSNAAKVVGYAQRRGVPVVLLQEPDDTMTW